MSSELIRQGWNAPHRAKRMQASEVSMTKLRNGWSYAALAGTLAFSGAAFAQQAVNSDPYSGVSQPPSDATITASPDPQPAPPPAAKPSPAVPVTALEAQPS